MKQFLPRFVLLASIQDRLIALAVICALVSMTIAGIAWSRQKEDLAVVHSLESTTRVVRAAMMTDMMHDAIHAEVVGAALAKVTQDDMAFAAAGENLRANLTVLVENYAKARKEASTDRARAALEKGQATVDRYRDVSQATYEQLRNGVPLHAALLTFHQSAEETEVVLGEVGDAIEQSAADTSAHAHEEMLSGLRLMAATLAVGLGVMVVLTPPLVLSVVRPIRQMLQAVTVLNTDEGDLSHRLPELNAEFADLSKQFNLFLDKITAVVAEVHLSASTIGTASNEIAAGNLDLSNRTEGAASDLQVTASSVQQLTAVVNQTVDVASQAKILASGASNVAEHGNAVMASMVTTMEGINESSRRIADIIGVIDGIAFQTNILALNAAVEAARAGEQGRGFAVVASEVRALAQRSATAAKEIKTLIDSSVVRVGSGFTLVREAGDTMKDIVSSVGKVNDLIADITTAAQAQQSGFHAISQSVVALDKRTQENAALVEEQAAAAESLRNQTVQLNGCIQGFKLREQGVMLRADPGVVDMF